MMDPENVLAIHCNSGKGRAGLTASALLYYLGLFQDPYECCKYFTLRRFTDFLGVG
jgi:protein-tyrosine phosphatase